MNFMIDLLKRTWIVFKQSFVGIIIGIIIAFLFTAYANSVPSAQVTYSHSKTSQTTVKGALDELIDLANNSGDCKKGYVKYESTIGKYVCMAINYSHTSNISDDGTRSGNYQNKLATKDVVTIPGSSKLHIKITYGTENNYDMLYVFLGTYTGDVTENMSAGQLSTYSGGKDVTTTVEFDVPGDTVTFAFYSDSSTSYYGYYAIVTNESEIDDSNCPSGYFEQTDSSGFTCVKKITCKRVESSHNLHTENCNQDSTYGCRLNRAVGESIVYGNAKALGTNLETGDAFDCDILGDGSYKTRSGNAARFYYVSTMNNGSLYTDSNVAVLSYYTNVSNGHDVDGLYAWASKTDSGETSSSKTNTKGPITAAKNLPGNAPVTWPGVSLQYKYRVITNENGANPIIFDYGNATSRLLTYQEVNNGCYDGSTAITTTNGLYSKCEFLFEGTQYADSSKVTKGFWLESTYNTYGNGANDIYVMDASADITDVTNTSLDGVRPAIEVPLSEISY